jgi:hypothetical protein
LNVEIGAEATLFPEKEYINGIFVALLNGKPRVKQIFKTESVYTEYSPAS